MKLNMKGQNLMVGMLWYGLFWWGDKILSHMYKKKKFKKRTFFSPFRDAYTHAYAIHTKERECDFNTKIHKNF